MWYSYHVLKVPKAVREDSIRLLMNNLEAIQNVVEADDVALEIRPRSIKIKIKKDGGFPLNKVSVFLEDILPKEVKVPFWG